MRLFKRDLHHDPFVQFGLWFEDAKRLRSIELPEAACLSTIDTKGFPDGRMVLLKAFDEHGFVFYTNLESVKGRSLAREPRAALTFYWEKLKRQVRLQGATELVTDAEADAYWITRPRLAQLGAWASQQSRPLESNTVLLKRVGQYALKYFGRHVPRPSYWTGLRVIPAKIEFWQERPNRLHDRFLYTKSKTGWDIERLYP
jgi:pyridoxamine 5'-phosphate oxidase